MATVKEILEKQKIQKDTLNRVISHPKTNESQRLTCEACVRFIDGFISDLESLE